MIGICSNCGNYDWDKEVRKEDKTVVRCPKCGHTWKSKALPLFILTGCSGVGKTTTALELQQRDTNFIILDADYFTFMPSETSEDWAAHVEQMESLSSDLMQCGLPVMWAMAGNLDRLKHTYHKRFFRDIHCLALVCDEQELRRRMQEGRQITDENWIQSSVDYNQYFMEHDHIGDTVFETFDITGKSKKEVADYVIHWMRKLI